MISVPRWAYGLLRWILRRCGWVEVPEPGLLPIWKAAFIGVGLGIRSGRERSYWVWESGSVLFFRFFPTGIDIVLVRAQVGKPLVRVWERTYKLAGIS